jgi:hypothetical protein
MSKHNSPAAYSDVKHVMDIALKKPGLIYECNTHGKAVNFKQRCNRYRNLMRDMAQEQMFGLPGVRAETAYDVLVIRQINEEGEPDRKGRRLVFDHERAVGKIIDPDTGEELHLPQMPSIIGDGND